ncbi:MAG: SIR2 family protein, partial [Candidatus Bathyarchaeia archaeon]
MQTDRMATFSEYLGQIVNSARSGKLSIWVGAGISKEMPSSLPLANELKFHLLESICKHPQLARIHEDYLRDGTDIGRQIRDYPLEAFIERIAEAVNDAVGTIAELFKSGLPNKNHFLIARLMERGYVREILTTNFDPLIEMALEALGLLPVVDFYVYSTETQFGRIGLEPKFPTIFKIHGSANAVESIRATLSAISRRAPLENRRKVLDHFLSSEGDILILGYSAKDDFDINPVLSEIEPKRRIFYVRHKKGYRTIKKLPRAFRHCDGHSLWCDTEELIEYLWKVLLKENWRASCDSWTKQISGDLFIRRGWSEVLDDWVDRIPLSTRFSIVASILDAIHQYDWAFKLFRSAEKISEEHGDKLATAIAIDRLALVERR